MDVDIFLIFGLGFFLFCIWLVVNVTRSDEREQYLRRVNEMREFGFDGEHKHNSRSPYPRK